MVESFALTNKGRVRPHNEDSFLVRPELGLYVVADGMGGARGGERASLLAVETVEETLRAAEQRNPSSLLHAVEEANRKVFGEASTQSGLEGMGTTLVVALELPPAGTPATSPASNPASNSPITDVKNGKNGHELAIASVGDSRAYLLNGNGLKLVTQDQTWVEQVGRPMGLDEENLKRHPMRHVLTMAVGVSADVEIRYYVVNLKPGNTLLLSSDGLHGVVPHEKIEQILGEEQAGNSTLEEKCYHLIEAALAEGGPDNITTVLLRRPK